MFIVMKLVAIGTLAVPLIVLFCTGLAVAVKWGDPSVYNAGPQGFAESLYAYVSQANNNGSAFAGFTGYLQPNGSNDGAFAITFANLRGGDDNCTVVIAGVRGQLPRTTPGETVGSTLKVVRPFRHAR